LPGSRTQDLKTESSFSFRHKNQNCYLPLGFITVLDAEEARRVEKDPVCGMDVDGKTARYTSSYKGKTYYFCSEICRRTFDNSPSRYAR